MPSPPLLIILSIRFVSLHKHPCTATSACTISSGSTPPSLLHSTMAQVVWNSDIDVYNPHVIPISVAECISWYLDIPDLLLFALTSRNAYKAVNDPRLWVLKLKSMGVWDSAYVATKQELAQSKFDLLQSPLTCLSHIYKVPRIAKFQVLKVRSCMFEYYHDLLRNIEYEKLKIFKNFDSPQDQALILTNLLKFNAIDTDEANRNMVRDKITDLIEIFENALLRELEIHFDIQDYEKTRSFVEILIGLKNDQTLMDFFLQKTCFDNDAIRFLLPESFSAESFFSPVEDLLKLENDELPETEDEVADDVTYQINETELDNFVSELSAIFNEISQVIDRIFPQSVPMMFKISEEIISNQLQEIAILLTNAAKEKNLLLQLVPLFYTKITHTFIAQLKPSKNAGESYNTLIHELIDCTFESFAAEYMNEEKMVFRNFCSSNVAQWNTAVKEREETTTQQILKHVKVETKNDFLTSFKKVFTINNASETKTDLEGELLLNYSQMQARAKILAENIKSLNEVFSPELALTILNEAKASFGRLMNLRDFTVNSIVMDLYATVQEEFIIVIECIGNDHLKIGFDKSLTYLKEYDPKEVSGYIESNNKGSAIGPLVIFFELINMADMIVQMLDIFYKEELINLKVVKHENSVLNPSLQSKKKLEGMIDKYVADGLNIGIDVLFKEIDSVYLSMLSDSDYNPPTNKPYIADGPTRAAVRVVQILEDNIDLLVDSAEKPIVEVFQQEVAERFFQDIVKVLKRSTISVDGAVTLISDLNLYYDFILTHIKSNKKMIFPLFQALKKVGSIYLIGGDEAKAIGQLVSDLSKFNGIFRQEEIYEFVQRRQDWSMIKRHVEKVMYGLSMADCTIM